MRKRIAALVLVLVLFLSLLPAKTRAAEDVVIVLDPGHGGLDSGAAEKYDGEEVWESTLNLKIAGYCRDYLVENYENVRVYLTRETDQKMSLDARIDFAVNKGADYLLSIHINSDDGYADGCLALVPRGKYRPSQAKASTETAEAILEELEKLGLQNLGPVVDYSKDDRYPDGSYVDTFAIVRGGVRNNIPAVIMEQAFLDNEDDYRNFLSTEEQLEALGRANALGLAKTLDLVERKIPSSADQGDTPFEDVLVGEWYYDDVTYVWDQGLMQGVSGTEFGPTGTANRAMVVTLLYRMDGAWLEPEYSTFEDVEVGSWYHAPVEWAQEQGITTGVSETEFAPARNVIREQFVTFLHRYAGSPEPVSMPENFSDWDSVSGYAEAPMAWAVEEGLVTGYDDGTVKPLRELNRAELAVLMHRFHRWYLHDQGELVYDWTLSDEYKALYLGESFELTLMNQYSETADPIWTADCEGVVEIDGSTITAVGEGSALLTCEWDGWLFECLVEVTKEVHTWKISHTDVTIIVGESFNLRLRNEDGETADVDWQAKKSGIVSISGNRITGKAKGTVTVSCVYEGETYSCIVRVKNS